MPILHRAGALMLGALLAAALPACSKHNAESPANPPTGLGTKTTPDTGGTGTAPAPESALPSPPATGAGNSTSGASGGSAATQGSQPTAPTSGATPADSPANVPGTSTPPTGQQPGR
ncbi:hypothetical protein SAMN05518865_11866 [Duganella sp. CF458]|uniref:hypothetical protein n=1 Tax=Duganella sp. CF458 TaxID=1884368 RepID=UPI0008EFEFF6|nr:hypothetical protein [Duganella sp. CF458]SFG77908.1 hypothetical protein SAMN05518865_11866 [Duganella sp. CF458]